jgi:non-heme chloroperoxidase
MGTYTANDGAHIFYKDWGTGRPIVFSHGWPLNADAWDNQLQYFASLGFRAIAHDRRGHGRSSQTWDGNHMDQYADDLAGLFAHLDLTDAVLIGHSTGGGEVTRYLGRHGTSRVSKAVLLGAIPPQLMISESNPDGVPVDVIEGIRSGLIADRGQFYRDFGTQFYSLNRAGAVVSQGVLDQFWRLSMQAGYTNAIQCITAFAETDFTEDLKKIDIPVLVAHAEDDQIVPVANAAPKAASLLKNSTLKIYPGASHGLVGAYQQTFNADLLDFIKN